MSCCRGALLRTSCRSSRRRPDSCILRPHPGFSVAHHMRDGIGPYDPELGCFALPAHSGMGRAFRSCSARSVAAVLPGDSVGVVVCVLTGGVHSHRLSPANLKRIRESIFFRRCFCHSVVTAGRNQGNPPQVAPAPRP